MFPLQQTKKLWIDRLNREKKLVESSPLSTPKPKPPQRLSISYPFSTSPLLQEQVRLPKPSLLVAKSDSFEGTHCLSPYIVRAD
jgi:hypothetical protein